MSAHYYVYFARQVDARQAARELRGAGFRTELREDDGTEWLVIASRDGLRRDELDLAAGEIQSVAYRFYGDYDGVDVGDD